jgi:SIR2-like domain
MPTVGDLVDGVQDFIGTRRPSNYDALLQLANDPEALLTYVADEQPHLTRAENSENKAMFFALSEWLSETLYNSQRYALGQGVAPGWADAIVDRWQREKATVLTLNYDTLVESTFASGSRQPFVYSELYPLSLPPIVQRTGAAVWGRDPNAPRAFNLIKLHGSLNWFYSGAETFYGEPIYDVDGVSFWNQGDRPTWEEVRSRAPGLVPMIIPPSHGKSAFLRNESAWV